MASRRGLWVRLPPTWAVVYFVLAVALFTDYGYRQAWAALTAGRPRAMVAGRPVDGSSAPDTEPIGPQAAPGPTPHAPPIPPGAANALVACGTAH
ncbi:transposase domain-containing protein [Streptomyces sp. GLT-R25]